MHNYTFHNPVLLREVLEYLNPQDGETYIDATFGAGGYTRAILASANCKVIAIDQDPTVEKFAAELKAQYPENFDFVKGNFGNLEDLVSEKVDGIVFDIGVSSMQLSDPERGFSFRADGPLDMRMSDQGPSAADFLNTAPEREIADVIYKYGEERNSRRIAKEIVNSRPLSTTSQLADIAKRVNGNFEKIDPATRTFQGVRIYINRELDVLERGLEAALKLVKAAGRIVVVTFHSLEDRIVKTFFKDHSGQGGNFNRHMPDNHFVTSSESAKKTSENGKNTLELITKKAIMAVGDELMHNPRARSAKLRAAKIKEIGHA